MRELIITDETCGTVELIGYDDDMCADVTGYGGGWTIEEIICCVRVAAKLERFTLQITEDPDLYTWSPGLEKGCHRVAEWLRDEFSARGSKVEANVQNLLCAR